MARGKTFKELYADGTKIEANANRYTFVWGNPNMTQSMAVCICC